MTRSLKTAVCFLLPALFIAGSYGQEVRDGGDSARKTICTRDVNSLPGASALILPDTLAPADETVYDDAVNPEVLGADDPVVNAAGAGSVVPGLSLRNAPKQKRFSFGVTVLLGTNHYHYKSGPVTGKSAFAFGAGLYGQFNMGFFAIRPEVLYERNQAHYPGGVVRPNALTVPLNLVLQIPESYPFGAYLSAGAYYRRTFSAEQGGHDVDFTNYYRNEGGISWGVGLRYGDVTVGVTKRYGVTDLLRTGHEGSNLRNRSIQLNLSYRF